MTQGQSQRLRDARMKAGFSTAQEAAEAFGWGVAGYRHHENGTRNFGLDAARKYGRAFRVKPGWLLKVDGIDDAPPADYAADEVLTVRGSVAAGVWREPSEDYAPLLIDTPAPVPNTKRFGLEVVGRSMDLHYAPGTILDCISIFANGVEPETGDHVIVERTKPDGLREITVKEVSKRDGRFYLIPRSTRPEFQAEIEIGSPSAEHHEGDEIIQVIGFVVSTISPRALRLLERMGRVSKP